ncbi:hypothetical protein BsWGS_09020 [Bradybaena similaris]
MKEYDQQISDLKKENFSLKLRIYYTEERLQQTFGDGKDVLKMNVQLQTEIDSLKQELIDKQVLIQKAAFAIETLTADREKEEESRNRLRTDYEKELNQLRDQLDKASQNIAISHREVDKAREEVEMLQQQLNDKTKELASSVKINEDLERTLEEMKLEQRQKDSLLDRYKRSVEGLMKSLQQKNEECESLREWVDEGRQQMQLLQAEIKENKLQSSKVHDLSLQHSNDVKLLMDLLHKEMKLLVISSQQLKDNAREDTNIKTWLTQASSIQRVYLKLQEVVEKNSPLYQTLMNSVQSVQGHSNSLENTFHHGHNMLEPVLHIPGCRELSSLQGKVQTGLGSLQGTSAGTGKSSAQSEVVTSPGNVSGRSPAGYSVVNELNTDYADSLLHSDLLSNINWWLQTPAITEGEGGEKLIEVSEDADLSQAQKSQSVLTCETARTTGSSVDLVKDFRRDNPGINISGVDLAENRNRSNLKMVSGVDSIEGLKKSNLKMASSMDLSKEMIHVPCLDSDENLRGNPVENSRKMSEVESVNNVITNHIASPHYSSSLAANSSEELFGTYTESQDNFLRFLHTSFSDEDQFGFHRHDRASSVKIDSQNATLTGRTVSEQMTSTHISHCSVRDSNSCSNGVSAAGSLSQVEEAQNMRCHTQQTADIDQNIIGSKQPADLDQKILDSRQQTDVNRNILGSQQLADVGQTILGTQQLSDVGQSILGSQQPADVGQNILGSQQPADNGQNILGSQQPADVSQNILGSQDKKNAEVSTQIQDLQEKLKATENTVKLLSRKYKVCLSALKAAGVSVNFMNRSNSESCLGSLSVSPGKRASSVGGLNILSPGQNNKSIERARSFVSDTFNQTRDVTCGSLAASIVATPSVTAVSLPDDATRISEISADILNHSKQHCTSNLNPPASQRSSVIMKDLFGNTNSNNHNTSYVGNASAYISTFPASPPASVNGSFLRISPHKDPHDISLSSQGQHHANPTPNSFSPFGSRDHTSINTLVKSGECESRKKSSLNVNEGNQNSLPVVTHSSSVIDNSWINHRTSLGGYPDVTYSSIVDNPETNHEVKSNMDISGVSEDRHPNVTYSSIMNTPLTNHGVKSNMDMIGDRQPVVNHSGNVDPHLMTTRVRSSVDKSEVSRGRSPDVTFSSFMDGSLMNRLLSNLEHSLSAHKEDTWNIDDLSVGQLRSHVEHLERVNLALKEEIRVYEALHGLQITQIHLNDKSSSQNQTGQELAGENLIKSSSKSRKSPETSEEDLLRQYLVEIKKIRQRLERLDLVKDPNQLLIYQSHTHQRIIHQEAVIAHMQQLMVEKKTQWQQEISELQHQLSREKVLAVEKLECTISQLQMTVRDQAEALREQEKQIVALKLCLDSHTNEDEMVKGEKSDFAAQLIKPNTNCLDDIKRLDNELEVKQKEIERLKVELEKEKESWRLLKEIVVKRERSLQEKILVLQKLTNEKAVVENALKEKEVEVRKLEEELRDLREKVQGVKGALDERTMLTDKIERLKEELRERENEEVRYDFQKMRYDAEIEKITEEKVKLSMDLEMESREKDVLKFRLCELEHKVLESVKLERQNRELKGEIKSLWTEVDKLNTKLDHRVVHEVEMRNRLKALGEVKSQVSLLREQLLKCEENLKVAEQSRDCAVDELKEREERLTKRNQQLHHLLQQYKKLEAAFTKQKSKLKEKTDHLQKLKQQIHMHENNLSACSDQSLNETNLSLGNESCEDAAFTSTPVPAHPVKQHSDPMLLKPCRRQLTYSAAETQPLEVLTTGSDMSFPVAILTRDCHDKLHYKTEECLLILAEIESRLGVYRTDYKSESKEFSILRETCASCQRLYTSLNETASWIAAAWITELPGSKIQAPNDHPVKSQQLQNEHPRNQIQQLPLDGTTAQSLAQQQNRPHKSHMAWEKTLYKQLYKTTRDLEQAKGNIHASLTSLPPPPPL